MMIFYASVVIFDDGQYHFQHFKRQLVHPFLNSLSLCRLPPLVRYVLLLPFFDCSLDCCLSLEYAHYRIIFSFEGIALVLVECVKLQKKTQMFEIALMQQPCFSAALYLVKALKLYRPV